MRVSKRASHDPGGLDIDLVRSIDASAGGSRPTRLAVNPLK
jgi:hypothetical protein